MDQELQIKAQNEDLKGVYANLMIVSHTKEEFCLDFINGFRPPMLVARVLTSPSHLKRMISALQDNLKKYEEKYGEIKETEQVRVKRVGFQP